MNLTPTHTIELTEPSASGYLCMPVDSYKFRILGKDYVVDPELIGSPSKVTFKIFALTEEPFDITFELKRPWEDEVAKTKTYHLNS